MKRILVVEDCPVNRFFLERGLSSKGYDVATVPHGQAALAWLEVSRADVVLMDLRMPGLDGVQTTRRIRKSPQPWAGLPIIAVTAFDSDEERKRCQEAGVDKMLAKPLVLAELQQVIEEVMTDTNAVSVAGCARGKRKSPPPC